MSSHNLLPIGHSSQMPLQASKWLDLQLLIDADEMKSLFAELGDFNIFKVGAVCRVDEGEISKEAFLTDYAAYIDQLKSGTIPSEKLYRPLFSSVFTRTNKALFQIPVAENRRIIRIAEPVVQLQVNQISYSALDGKFRAMVFSKECILWGIQFSYPQLFQNPLTREVFQVLSDDTFPNTALFRRLQLWTRQHTLPTPFQIEGRKVNVPMRLGKNCLSWINQHPQIITNNFRVLV